MFSWWKKFEPPGASYELTRSLFVRCLGFIYFVAYLSLNRQVLALLGKHGLLPVELFLNQVRMALQQPTAGCFLRLPSIFWIRCSDTWLIAGSYLGLFIAVLIMAGVANAGVMALQWFLYLSYVHIGQEFYGFGWETMTLEAGFLAIFLCPLLSIRPDPLRSPTPKVILWFYRWMLFRVMFGAGLIKLRGDECWRDLTCLVYHYETQPLPNPISWYLHQMPMWFHKSGCLFNHFVELIVPWFYFAPRKIRYAAGIFTVVFQVILIISGNLSFLNWLTIVIAIPCFDDDALRFVRNLFRRSSSDRTAPSEATASAENSHVSWGLPIRRIVLSCVSALLICLSIYPIRNMISSSQLMNASFDRLHLMNTYGAFGSVGRVRNEIILEATMDSVPDDRAEWKAYEFLAKPGDPKRRPPFIAPYQSRIDWQIWFAAMEEPQENPWLIHFIYKLLHADPPSLRLLNSDPFGGKAPRFIRADLYEYHFTKDRKASGGAWWERTRIGAYLPPLSKDDANLRRYIHASGWSD